jgi:uncharacterized protein YgbK (DUF1537 family)
VHARVTGRVAILADDLTGALDTAAAFAAPARPVRAVWADTGLDDGVDLAIDSETRAVPEDEAEATVARLLPRLRGKGIGYKKIDSLLRGNTIAEVAACARSDAFGAIVVAPAFPAQDRVMRHGRQFAFASGEWQPVGPAIGDALRSRSVPSRLVGRSETASGSGVIICDAESDKDLAAIAAADGDLAAPVLWCGSAGLARALAGPRDPVTLPRVGSVLALVSSRHEVSRGQVRRLAEASPTMVVSLRSPVAADEAVAAVAARLMAQGRAALAFDLAATLPGDDAETLLTAVCEGLVETVAQPDLIVVAGGDTLMNLTGALGATRLETIGEWRPGMPVSRFPDGRWRGTGILSKSGAFGGETTLVDAFDSLAG